MMLWYIMIWYVVVVVSKSTYYTKKNFKPFILFIYSTLMFEFPESESELAVVVEIGFGTYVSAQYSSVGDIMRLTYWTASWNFSPHLFGLGFELGSNDGAVPPAAAVRRAL